MASVRPRATEFFARVRRDNETFAIYLERRGASANTIKQYLSRIRRLEKVKDPISRAIDLLTGSEGAGYAPKTRRAMQAAYRAWGKYTGNQELLQALDELRLPPAVRRKVQVPLPPDVYRRIRDELARAVDYIDDPERAVLGLMACRGLRRGDALRLRREEVVDALRQGTLNHLVKGHKRLEFGVLPTFSQYLEILASKNNWRAAHELVSSSVEGAEKAIPAALRRVAEHVDLGDVEVDNVRGHVLRRTYAVAYYEACGRDPNKLRAHMGWSNIATAMNYVDFVQRGELDEIAASMFL